MEELRKQVEKLNLQLDKQEHSFAQRIQGEQAKTQVASQALQKAMQKFDALQQLAMGLQAAMKQLSKEQS